MSLTVAGTKEGSECPKCGVSSTRFHSSYIRTVQDSPIGLLIVWLQVIVRRYRCANPVCHLQTFAEQHLEFFGRRKKRTQRLLESVTHIGLALGGNAGARLAKKLAMSVSPSTMLRLLHQLTVPEVASPKIIGIDDWAFRKGRNYGTIIVDHETGKPIDLLPERDSETVAAWLEKYPTITIVTRDRSGEFREAISKALPEATQIADRWHLLKNLREALERHLSRRYASLRKLVGSSSLIEPEIVEESQTELEIEVVQATQNKVQASGSDNQSTYDEGVPLGNHRRYAPGPARETLHAARTQERERLFEQVKARHASGVYIKDIAKEVNLSRTVVTQWVKYESLPPDGRGRFKKKCLIDDYIPYIRQRLDAGCTNQSQIWREIQVQGFTGARTLVGKWIRQHYHADNDISQTLVPKVVEPTIPSAKELSWLLIHHKDELTDEEQKLVTQLLQDEELSEFRQLAHRFGHILRNLLGEKYPSWLEDALKSTVQELKNFAIGLKRDAEAVLEATQQIYSNGRTEGHVNRLKFIKRQMYGRASFKLLRIRVLLADR